MNANAIALTASQRRRDMPARGERSATGCHEEKDRRRLSIHHRWTCEITEGHDSCCIYVKRIAWHIMYSICTYVHTRALRYIRLPEIFHGNKMRASDFAGEYSKHSDKNISLSSWDKRPRGVFIYVLLSTIWYILIIHTRVCSHNASIRD